MAKKSWARIFSRLVGKLITGQEDDAEFDNVYTALNDIENRKVERDGTLDMTGNLVVNLANAGIFLKNAPNQIARVISDANGLNLTFNAYIDSSGNWRRDDTTQGAERLYITNGYVYHYSAPPGANPISWNLDWQIADNGLATIYPIGITFSEQYNATQRAISQATWTTLHTINLTVPSRSNRIYIVEGFANVSSAGSTEARIMQGTTEICHDYFAGGPYITRYTVSGRRILSLAPGSYTFTFDVCCGAQNSYVNYSEFGIVGGWISA